MASDEQIERALMYPTTVSAETTFALASEVQKLRSLVAQARELLVPVDVCVCGASYPRNELSPMYAIHKKHCDNAAQSPPQPSNPTLPPFPGFILGHAPSQRETDELLQSAKQPHPENCCPVCKSPQVWETGIGWIIQHQPGCNAPNPIFDMVFESFKKHTGPVTEASFTYPWQSVVPRASEQPTKPEGDAFDGCWNQATVDLSEPYRVAKYFWQAAEQHVRAGADKFKTYVHQRLDNAAIPTHPNGPHSAKCRVGDRLDILVKRMNDAIDARADLSARMAEVREELVSLADAHNHRGDYNRGAHDALCGAIVRIDAALAEGKAK